MKKFKKPQFKLLKEFKAFITKGNVVDLAVGMIIGAAFTAIVTALVNNIFKPLINAIPMGNIEGLITMLVSKNSEGLTLDQFVAAGNAASAFAVDLTKSVYIDWGAFIMAIINFLITALVLFSLVKLINMVRGGFTGLRHDAQFMESLTDEEKATIKGKVPTKKELRAIKAARDEKEARAQAEAQAAQEANKPETTEDILRQIRDLLKAQQLRARRSSSTRQASTLPRPTINNPYWQKTALFRAVFLCFEKAKRCAQSSVFCKNQVANLLFARRFSRRRALSSLAQTRC